MSYRRTMEDAETLFELAKQRAGKSPKVILTDKLNLYPSAIAKVFGGDTAHEQSTPFVKVETGDSTRAIERWHETLKERTKVIYGLKDANSALAFLDGFFAHYNFIRGHEGLDGKTPAEVAGIKYDVKSWADVTHIGEQQESKYLRQYEINPELLIARQEITGEPYKPGPHYGSKKGVNKEAIMAAEKRKLKAKIKTKRLNGATRMRAIKEARQEAQGMVLGQTRKSPRYERNEQGLTRRQLRERGGYEGRV